MPNFTEGEWKSEDGFIWAHKDGMVKMVADFIPDESDSRLMAQSKKMYEVLCKAVQDYVRVLLGEDALFDWGEDARAILSEIDKE